MSERPPEDEQHPAEDEQPAAEGEQPPPEDEAPGKLSRAVKRTDREPRLVRAARMARSMLPGDKELGDPLSLSGDRPSSVVARRMAEGSGDRESLARELGLGALQVWQALSEVQGRGRGDQEVTILFTDLVDFSSWSLEAGDEATLELLRGVGRASESAVTDEGGKVVKRLGDGLMAVFIETQPAVQAALRACRAVAEVQVEGYQPRLRAGVHVGRPRKLGGDYLGVDVNVAARVAEAAGGDQVLVSGLACERLDGDAFRLKRLRRFKAKGAPKDLEVFSVAPAG